VRVEIWSDIVCPWCYIGKRRFEAALARFDGRDEVEVVWKSFELNPEAPINRGSTTAHLMSKYGWTEEQVDASQSRIEQLAAVEGLEYDLKRSQGGNTLPAHSLLHLAAEQGLQDALKERFLRAYLCEREAIGEAEVLVRLAGEVGVAGAEEALASGLYSEAVRADEREAGLLGIHAVPFFVIDRYYGVEGAQPPETILQALEEAASASRAATAQA
jgi:predicted DsbA family dithiol-disulfide isomerase